MCLGESSSGNGRIKETNGVTGVDSWNLLCDEEEV